LRVERKTTQGMTRVGCGNLLMLIKTTQALREATRGAKASKKMVTDENEEYGPQENGQETVTVLIFMKQGKGKEKSQNGEE